MSDLSLSKNLAVYKPKNKIRFVTATSLFDGHDASINIMRRILQSTGAEVIHLGHNRSVEEIVTAALQEDVQGIAITSYQGGHIEFFKYMLDLLRQRGGANIKIFGGGGGVIVPSEIQELHAYGVTRIYSPEDGQKLGLQGMLNEVAQASDEDLSPLAPQDEASIFKALASGDRRALAHIITALENGSYSESIRTAMKNAAKKAEIPTLGITGTGGAGKSSLTDELVRRFRLDQGDALNIAILSIDPSRKRTGGALLGDRIRMNAIQSPRVFMRSLATRDTGNEISTALPEVIAACKLAGFDLIVIETSGIGQGNAAIVPLVDTSLYVMTPEFGAASQLEKIDMLDFADFVAINKFDRKGAEDALRDVRKQYQRNHTAFDRAPEEMPVFGTMAAHFNDDGVTALYQALLPRLQKAGLKARPGALSRVSVSASTGQSSIVPAQRTRYLAEIAETVRNYHNETRKQANLARERQALTIAKTLFAQCGKEGSPFDEMISWKDGELTAEAKKLLNEWPELRERYLSDEFVVKIRDKETRTRLTSTSLSGSTIRKVIPPRFEDDAETLKFLRNENLPGYFPYTAGVFPFKRENEDPTRMFAGEGDAFRTNRRFKKVSEGMPAHRLSTAFDSVTLYGCDPDERPDIYGKIGNSGVSIATFEDMKVLYSGFDLCAPSTSVSMTINGPAPIILAFFFNTAFDQEAEKFRAEHGRDPTPEEAEKIRAFVFANVRGTVQADILKEDQGQNTCIFSTEFALKMMGDIQEYFVQKNVRNFYSVSISGYHIAEAGANPISQLAFTLANGFTYVETYLARGMKIDDFAPNLSFFFSNGMEPEYSVIGRVARRIWSVAMKNKYGGNDRSQKLKYHIQTSGRSLHAQEMDFNDIRTTLQALIAIYDNCNSLHTNAYDEAITTPTDESVRRAMAVQLIINREWGTARNENPNQGAFVLEEMTDLVEEAVLKEFEAIAARGGVLGAMETGYQRGKIQEESLYYEHKKHDGSYPIIGVNTFLNPKGQAQPEIELARSTEEEKQSQIKRLGDFHEKNREHAPAILKKLQDTAVSGGNIFAVLVDAVRYCSLGQITDALYEVGGQYRRSM
ncbi:MAG: methylmalonyl-CoA mutase family protein [Betaproteobacteria bacterium]|nr:methylmalonyl-CoA mutase family protein [Betaproteobacteria bacterium]